MLFFPQPKRCFPLTHAGLISVVAVCALGACAVGPTYHRPALATPTVYKELDGWVQATPADGSDRSDWWTWFDDPVLTGLMQQVAVSNQNVAAATAAYAQARATVREQRAALFPVVTLDGSGRRAGGAGNANPGNNFQANIGASWEPDVWGRLHRAAESADASAAASAADLASALLSVRGELATDYLSLRQSDAQRVLLQATVSGYQRALLITQNRYRAGIAPKTDLLQAQTQLANAQADEAGLTRQRAQFEHAIAVLIGQMPGNFSLPVLASWQPVVPTVPVGVPSTLLQRRPDIAAAERRVAATNEQIGIAQAARYPNLGLSGNTGTGGRTVADLFAVSTNVWSLGVSAAQVLFNAGATKARVESAQAVQEQAAARYRQTVLVAFEAVEDQLAASRILTQQKSLREQASNAADQTEAQALNRYRAGQVSYTDVVAAQASALAARRALVQLNADRQVNAVALIQALGGGWQP